jgi:hypothetical protein
MSDTIILDSKKCNVELLNIYADGRITVAEHLKPTETAVKVLQIMREQWMGDAQATKIREQEERIKRLEEAGDKLTPGAAAALMWSEIEAWNKAKEAKP